MALAHVRRDYHGTPLLESRSPKEPFALFQRWLRRALAADLVEPNAMSIATLDARRRPRVRRASVAAARAAVGVDALALVVVVRVAVLGLREWDLHRRRLLGSHQQSSQRRPLLRLHPSHQCKQLLRR